MDRISNKYHDYILNIKTYSLFQYVCFSGCIIINLEFNLCKSEICWDNSHFINIFYLKFISLNDTIFISTHTHTHTHTHTQAHTHTHTRVCVCVCVLVNGENQILVYVIISGMSDDCRGIKLVASAIDSAPIQLLDTYVLSLIFGYLLMNRAIYIYIYIYTERDRDRERKRVPIV